MADRASATDVRPSASHLPLRRLSRHAAALGVVLVVFALVTGPDATFSSDEGAAVLQARSLSEEGTWFIGHPFPEVDPDGDAFPLEKSAAGADGFAPLPKQLAYPALLAVADLLAGTWGMVLLSVAGSVAAAYLAGVAGALMRPDLGAATLWLTGAASPLFVDSFLVMAHTIAAACVAGALVAVLSVERGRGAAAAGCAVALAASAGLLRAEAVLVAGALGAATAMVGIRCRRPVMVGTGAAVAAAGLSARVAGSALVDAILVADGTSTAAPSVAPAATGGSGSDYVSDRLAAFVTTFLRPAYEPELGSVLAVAVLALGGIAAVAIRRKDVDGALVKTAAVGVMALAAVRLLVPRPDPDVVPGLLMAFPALLWGVLLLRRHHVRRPVVQLTLAASAIFAVLVLMTQYPEGGAWEWGGRYFAAGIPLLTPLLALAFVDAGERMGPDVARAALGGLVIASVASSWIGVTAVARTHQLSERLIESVSSLAAATVPGDGGDPVVLTTEPELPRLAWSRFDEHRWLLVPPEAVPAQLAALADAGVEELVLATRDAEAAPTVARSDYRALAPAPHRATDRWWITELER